MNYFLLEGLYGQGKLELYGLTSCINETIKMTQVFEKRVKNQFTFKKPQSAPSSRRPKFFDKSINADG